MSLTCAYARGLCEGDDVPGVAVIEPPKQSKASDRAGLPGTKERGVLVSGSEVWCEY
jgi:hypothetical protein